MSASGHYPENIRFRLLVIFVFMALFVVSWSVPKQQVQAGAPDPTRTVFVQLFMWRWADIARECETFLGPKGYAAVQVSPPQQHPADKTAWWAVYQPVSYKIGGHLGTEAEFLDMVDRCHAVNVKIYADVVINHMASGTGQADGDAATTFSNGGGHNYSFPNLGFGSSYVSTDFHWNVNGATKCEGKVDNYNSQHAVQHCELGVDPPWLPDLATETGKVQDTIAKYLVYLYQNLHVDGFRIDAAKHIDAGEILAILNKVDTQLGVFDPDHPDTHPYYVVQEVIDPGTEAVKKEWYTPHGDVDEFNYGKILKLFFTGVNDKNISMLEGLGEGYCGDLPGGAFETMCLGPSDKMVPLIDNHDMERSVDKGDYLHYQDPKNYVMANIFMLAWPYGYPQVYSGYQFDNTSQASMDAAPSANGPFNGDTSLCPTSPRWNLNYTSSNGWVCQHHWTAIANMVGFRNTTQGQGVINWWDNGGNQIAFGRGDKGFVVINKEADDANQAHYLNQTLQTGLPGGIYCDVISGGRSNDGRSCLGAKIVVGRDGQATFRVYPGYAIAIHTDAKLFGGAAYTGSFTPSQHLNLAGGDGNGYETIPQAKYGNALFMDDDVFARDENSGTDFSTTCTSNTKDRIEFRSFGIPLLPNGTTITNIYVNIQAKIFNHGQAFGYNKFCASLSWNNGNNWTNCKEVTVMNTVEQPYQIVFPNNGANGDHVWTINELSNLRMRLVDVTTNYQTLDFYLDWLGVNVQVTLP